MEIKNIQENIKNGYALHFYDTEELRYIEKPLGKQIYKHYSENDEEIVLEGKKKKPHWRDRVECKICKARVRRCNLSRHRKTKFHKIYQNMQEKFRYFILDENKL
jgi:hypothetical protein